MNAKNKVTFIISLISFQVFYLLANYTTKYLNFFFLLTFLIAVVVCYCLYRLIMQLFVIFNIPVFTLAVRITLFLRFWSPNDWLQNSPISRLITRFFFLKIP